MRITNSMISNNSQIHIGNAKTQLMRSQDQYTTQKKIQRPSDDPTIAIRALQLRTTYSQIRQYSEKNIKDAVEWMEETESCMRTIDSVLGYMKEKLDQGANDTYDAKERNDILKTLQGYADAIFEDNANGKFSDRYLFTGYRTDTPLLFMEDTDDQHKNTLEYQIQEKFDSKDVLAVKAVTQSADYTKDTVPVESQVYRIHLAYDKCALASEMTYAPYKEYDSTHADVSIAVSLGGTTYFSGDDSEKYKVVVKASPIDDSAYLVEDADTINYIPETGELILGKNVYNELQETGQTLEVNYLKREFEKGDIRPEMYFQCSSFNTSSNRPISYAEPDKQDIRYEINFSQVEKVNVQARDAIDTNIYRMVDYIAQTVHAVEALENKIADVDKQIANTSDTTELEKEKELLEKELSLRTGVMQEAFSKGLTMVSEAQDKLNVSIADVGARDKRLLLTQDKLADQKVDTEEKMSENEDIDIADAYINLTQADNLYQASLSATAKILGNSLLNYI